MACFRFLFLSLIRAHTSFWGQNGESLFSHIYIDTHTRCTFLFVPPLLLLCHLGKLETRYFMDGQKNAENKLSAHKNGADTTFISHINFFVAFKLEDMSWIKLTVLQTQIQAFYLLHLDSTMCTNNDACLLTEG